MRERPIPSIDELRELRISMNLSLEEMARHLRIKRPTLSGWELKQHYPGMYELCRYEYCLKQIRAGRIKAERSSIRIMHARLKSRPKEPVSPADVKALWRRCTRLGVSLSLLETQTGYSREHLKQRLTVTHKLDAKEYTAILNVIYDLEQKGYTAPIPQEDRPRLNQMLRRYKSSCIRLTHLKLRHAELSARNSVHVQNYENVPQNTGEHADPVAHRCIDLDRLEHVIQKIEGYIAPMREAYNFLKDAKAEREREMFLILERHVMERESLSDISADTDIPERTLYRRKHELHSLVYTLWKAGESCGGN